MAAIAHEFGHVYHSHRCQNILLLCLYLALLIGVFMIFYSSETLLQSFGFNYQSAAVRCFLFTMFYYPLSFFIDVIRNTFSRHYEYEADRFAVQCGYGMSLRQTLLDASMKDRGVLLHTPMYVFFYCTHPTPIDRTNHILEQIKKTDVEVSTLES